MSQVIFASLEELVGNVSDGDDRSAYIVKHRNKDYYCLAESELEAMGAVLESMNAECGLVPLDMIVKASAAAMSFPAGANEPADEPNGILEPVAEVALNGLTKAELVDEAKKRGIDWISASNPKSDFVKVLRAYAKHFEEIKESGVGILCVDKLAPSEPGKQNDEPAPESAA